MQNKDDTNLISDLTGLGKVVNSKIAEKSYEDARAQTRNLER